MTAEKMEIVSHSARGKIVFTRGEDIAVDVKFNSNTLYPHLAEVTVEHSDFHHHFTTEIRQLDQGRYRGVESRNTTVFPWQGGQVGIQVHTDRLRVNIIVPVNDVSLFVNRAQAIATRVDKQVACPNCHERAVLFDDGTVVCVVEGQSFSAK